MKVHMRVISRLVATSDCSVLYRPAAEERMLSRSLASLRTLMAHLASTYGQQDTAHRAVTRVFSYGIAPPLT